MKQTLLVTYLLLFSFCTFAEKTPVYSPFLQINKNAQLEVKTKLQKLKINPIFFSKYMEFESYLKFAKPSSYVRLLSEKDFKNRKYKYLLSPEVKLVALAKSKIPKSKIKKLKIGAVLITDRKSQKALIEKKLKSKFRLLKTVSKEEDLLPLLIFSSVDVVLVDSRALDIIKERFKIKLVKQSWKLILKGEALVQNYGKKGTKK